MGAIICGLVPHAVVHSCGLPGMVIYARLLPWLPQAWRSGFKLGQTTSPGFYSTFRFV